MGVERRVAIIVGSLRKESINRKIAHAIINLAPPQLKFEFVDIGGLPLYDQDLDENPPASWTALRDKIRGVDALLFVTPEYNRSVPGVLKNALDIASRPYGKNAWDGKPGAVISSSPGSVGGFGANHHLRQVLTYLNVPTLAQPEVYLAAADKIVGAGGTISNEGTRNFLDGFMKAFAAWIETNAPKAATA